MTRLKDTIHGETSPNSKEIDYSSGSTGTGISVEEILAIYLKCQLHDLFEILKPFKYITFWTWQMIIKMFFKMQVSKSIRRVSN